MKSVVCHEPLMPQGRYLFCFAKKGDPDIRPMRNGCEICSENVARSETRCAQTTDRFIDVFTPNLGVEYTGTSSNNVCNRLIFMNLCWTIARSVNKVNARWSYGRRKQDS